jgi:bla regulator protein BlaR1
MIVRVLLMGAVLAIAVGQAPAADPEARFEVVSFKEFDASSRPRSNMSPGGFEYSGLNAAGLISFGLQVPPNRLVGLPDWKDRYAVSAKPAVGAPLSVNAMIIMIANLVKDRFKLVTHTETREMPVYNLAFARQDKRYGPTLKESSAECRAKIEARSQASRRGAPAQSSSTDACINLKLTPALVGANGAQMPILVSLLTQSTGRPVIDKTGLTSYYDFTLKWTPDPGSRGLLAPDAPPPPDPDAPDLFTRCKSSSG